MDCKTGDLISAKQAEIVIYFWRINNPLYFKLEELLEQPFGNPYDIITLLDKVQLQFKKGLEDSQMLDQFQVLDIFDSQGL